MSLEKKDKPDTGLEGEVNPDQTETNKPEDANNREKSTAPKLAEMTEVSRTPITKVRKRIPLILQK